MYPFLAELSEKSSAAISCYPNAGLPNPLSPTGFDLEPRGHGALPGRVRAGRAHQHRRRLLRQHAGAHRGDRRSRCAVSRRATECTGDRDACDARRTCRMSVRCVSRVRSRSRSSPAFHDDRRARPTSPVRRSSRSSSRRASYEEAVSVARQQVENGAQRHRHLHGRGHDRRRRGDDALPAAPRERAGSRQGAVHGRLLEVGGHRGRPEMPAGQGHRELDFAEGRRGEVSASSAKLVLRTARPSS